MTQPDYQFRFRLTLYILVLWAIGSAILMVQIHSSAYRAGVRDGYMLDRTRGVLNQMDRK